MSLKLFLDTRDASSLRNTGSRTPADSTWIFGEILPNTVSNVGVCLEAASIPNIIPTIKTGSNTLVFFENGLTVPRTATIAPGFYDGLTLATALQSAMNSAGAANTYTVSYSTITRKFTITTTISNTFAITAASTSLEILGFQAAPTSYTLSKIAAFVINLVPTRYVDICVNFNAASIALSKRPNILQRVHLNNAVGNVIFYQASILSQVVTSAESLRQIEVRLYDDRGILYDIDSNHNCSYNLLLTPLD